MSLLSKRREQSHVNITSDDKGQLFIRIVSSITLPLDSRVESVGIGIQEEAGKVGIGNIGYGAVDSTFYCGRIKSAAGRGGALV